MKYGVALLGLFLIAPCQALTLNVSRTSSAEFHTIQAALDALPETGGEIVIGAGIWREKLRIAKAHVTLRGAGRNAADTVIVYGDSAATAGGTFNSYTVNVSGDDFQASNLTIQNDYWLDPSHAPSQAVALHLTGDRAVLRHVRLLGHQDTLYSGKGPNGRMARHYFADCYIEGHVDFIFGNAKAYFDRCELHALAHDQVMYTAQSRNAADEDSAFVFDHCTLTAEDDAHNIILGRPWRPYASVVFLDTEMHASVVPEGWRDWHPGETQSLPTTFYAEFHSTGPGANPSMRDPATHQLSQDEAKHWRLNEFFKHDVDWIRRDSP